MNLLFQSIEAFYPNGVTIEMMLKMRNHHFQINYQSIKVTRVCEFSVEITAVLPFQLTVSTNIRL